MLNNDFAIIKLHQNVGEIALTSCDAAAAWTCREPKDAAGNIANRLTFRNGVRVG